YTETWNIRGRAMFCGDGSDTFAWSWNPDGYRPEISPWGKVCLREANRARDKLMPSVAAFCDTFVITHTEDKNVRRAPEASVTDICRAIVTFARQIGLPARLLSRSREEIRSGRREEGAKTALVWEKICQALDKMVSLLGDTTLDAGRFSGLFGKVIASMDVGAIPTAMDEVLLGSADGIRFGQADHVILVGAVEGQFPADVSENGFFRDSDRILLEGAGIDLAGSSEEYLAEEYWMFYRTAASAARTLTVLCPLTNGGETCTPSPAVERITALARIKPLHWRKLPPENRIFHTAARPEDPSLSAWLGRKQGAVPRYYPGLMDASDDHADPDAIGDLLNGRMRLTQSRLDCFSGCPFRYWCQYGMVLQEPPHAAITAPDIGNFVHAILEQFFKETADRTYPLPPEETETLADTLVRGYLSRLGVEETGRLGYLFLRLRRSVSVFLEAIMEEYAQGRFVPMAFEMPVGLPAADDGTPVVRPVTLTTEGGVQVTLSGIIDRVDRYTASDGQEYVRVVDYKTGSRTFSLKEVRQGLHVQLLLYLFALWQGGIPGKGASEATKLLPGTTQLLPAGAVYFQVRPGETASEAMLTPEEARNKAVDGVNRSGIWLKDEEVLEAMDAGLSGKYVPVTRKKDGSLTGRATLQDLAQFGALYEELRTIIAGIAGEMAAGRSAAQPKTSRGMKECTYCPFGPVCRTGGK
ncbi:MAG: PD-(D/E)XK nuclease family protein, partial [Clostridia bacterium]|nr:PD-(D/E)XK nuclease family protein [Clostridia bacterium]